MAINLISKSDLARHAGVTRQAINKAVNSRRLPVIKVKGKEGVDLNDPTVLTYITECNARIGRTWELPQPKPIEKPVISPEPPPIVIPKIEPPKIEKRPEPEQAEFSSDIGIPVSDLVKGPSLETTPDRPPFIPPPPEPQKESPRGEKVKAPLKGLANIPKAELDKWHKYEQALKVQADREYARGELIERKLVQQVFSKLYSIDKSEFCTIGAKLSPDIAAIMEVNDPAIVLKITERIDKETYKVLSHIQRIINDFLVGLGERKVE